MAAPVYRVQGAAALRRRLRVMSDDKGKVLLRQLRGELRGAAEIVARHSRGKVPNRSGRSTGRTAAAIKAASTTTRARVQVRLPYAGPVHWGWPDRPNPAKGWRGGPIRQSAYIATAATETQPQWLRVYEAGLRALIENGN